MRLTLFLLIFLASCNPCRRISKHAECFPADTFFIEKTKIINDTTYLVDYDEIGFEAWLQCDSMYNVILSEASQSSGVINSLKLENNKLKLKANTRIPVRIRTEYVKNDSIVHVVNPVNETIRSQNISLESKNNRLTRQRNILSIIGLLLLVIIGIIVKLR